MDHQIKGTVAIIEEAQTFASGSTKQSFVVKTEGEYPQMLKFDLWKEKIGQLEPVIEGDEVTVHFDLRGNEYNGKFYVNLNAWKIDRGVSPEGNAQQFTGGGGEESDIPF